MTSAEAHAGTGEFEPPRFRWGVHRPWRAAVAVVELLVAAALLLLAHQLWMWGFTPVEAVGPRGGVIASTRVWGNWLLLAVLSATAAGVLVLDSIREVMLSWAVRRRRRFRAESTEDTEV